ncbi:MAG: HAMP domain-containing sensor histidine kinase [Chloroflexi bacterium]|nr:HAMP domain-containing sensor histidine kinase [Chloroflexota bacterium]
MTHKPRPDLLESPYAGLPTPRWPWQRSLQYRIVFTYSTVVFLILLLLITLIGIIIYDTQIEQADRQLEIEAFLARNALQDPLNGYITELKEHEQWRDQHGEPHTSSSAPDADDQKSNSANELQPPRTLRLQQAATLYAATIGTRVTILDPSGRPLADSRYPVTQLVNQGQQPEVQMALRKLDRRDIRVDPLSGMLMLYVAAPIQQDDAIVGVVQLSRPMTYILAKVQKLLTTVIVLGVLALVLVTVLGVLLGRRLVSPLIAMKEAALAIASGDLERQAPIETADELGALAYAFNRMVQVLRRSMEQQREFIANASHELRTPLTNIKLRSETLLDVGERDPALTRRYLAEIDSEADRLRRLSNTLLDLALLDEKIGSKQPPTERVDLAVLLRRVADIMELRMQQANLTLLRSVPNDLPLLRVAAEDIETILINLLSNAVNYTPAGGTVQLAAQVVNGRCQLRVQDTGPGILPEDLSHIFERFYRVDKAHSRRSAKAGNGTGAGLGLSIVQAQVEQMGGRIWVESPPGQGACFTVELPLDGA